MEVREAGDGAPCGESPKRYSWAEVRQAVHDLRKELAALCGMAPVAISFRKLGGGATRVYFLRTPRPGWEVTLLYADVAPGARPCEARLEWKPLFESVALSVAGGKWSREEQLLWERQRAAAWGIASYELHARTGRVLFPCASSLFEAAERPGQAPPLLPRALAAGGGAALQPAMCPARPALAAHAARGDLWLAGAALRAPARLTHAARGPGAARLADEPRAAGVPSYVMQEEFSRYTGFWWQPSSPDDVYRIVYEEVDESDVKIFSFPSSQTSTGDVEEFRFPRAGTPNAKSVLKLVTFRLQKASPTTVLDYYQEGAADASELSDMEVTDIRWYELRQPLKDAFPWFEYLVRVGWTPCGQYVWVQLLDRKQQRLELALLPLGEFSARSQYARAPAPPAPPEPAPAPPAPPVRGAQLLLAERAPDAWINVHDVLRFLPAPERTARFVWASEESGHLHLQLYTCRLRDADAEPAPSVIELMVPDEETVAAGPDVLSKQVLTAGEWEVMPRNVWVDEARGWVYFVGLRETPLERHLYAVPLPPAPAPGAPAPAPAPAAPRLLTEPGRSCTVDIDDECTMAVITSSSISSPPTTRVYSIVHSPQPRLLLAGTLCDQEPGARGHGGAWDSGTDDEGAGAGALLRESALAAVPPPQIYSTLLSCGARAYCTLWRGAGGAGRRPTVLHVYGGPEVQTVTNSYKGIRQLRMHMLAARGFNVVCVDSRGSKHRGRAWEAALRGRMGQVELDDQVEVLQWLAKETGCIDMQRVAVHGWSYGGYLSLLALATRPSVFKVCVAGAPVTCWRLYDTAYTERYLGVPARAPHAYTRASVLAHAPFFPDQEGRLLIIHGLADENVHFGHTAALLGELVRLGKPHRVQLYPGERHSLRAVHAAKHYEATLLHFLHENL